MPKTTLTLTNIVNPSQSSPKNSKNSFSTVIGAPLRGLRSLISTVTFTLFRRSTSKSSGNGLNQWTTGLATQQHGWPGPLTSRETSSSTIPTTNQDSPPKQPQKSLSDADTGILVTALETQIHLQCALQ